MKTITQTYKIHAPVEKVWDALVNPEQIDAWGGGPAKMSDIEGEKFSLWGGDIHGTNTKIVPLKVLEQDWYGGKWDKPSKVTFKLSEKEDTTTLELHHKNIPDESVQDIEEGWKKYYCEPLITFTE